MRQTWDPMLSHLTEVELVAKQLGAAQMPMDSTSLAQPQLAEWSPVDKNTEVLGEARLEVMGARTDETASVLPLRQHSPWPPPSKIQPQRRLSFHSQTPCPHLWPRVLEGGSWGG